MRGRVVTAVGSWLALSASSAWGQTAGPTAASPPTVVQEVIITGSHIPVANPAGGEVEVLERKTIAAEGDVRLEEAIAKLPQAFPGQSLRDNDGASGIATVNLRDLGDERTLVLIDGKRLMPGDPTSGSIAPDLNFIPAALVNHVEILTGGASAVYGSDAVAGVVNIILDDDFNGARFDAESGFYNHHNGQAQMRGLLAANGDAAPPGTVNDGLTRDLNLAIGVQSRDRRGHLVLYGGYRASDAVVQSQRDFSACALGTPGTYMLCRGSTRSLPLGQFVVYDPNSHAVGDFTLDPAGPAGALRAFNLQRDVFNFAPYDYFQRPDRRWTAGAFARFEADPRFVVYAQAMFMDDESTIQLAPPGVFGHSDPAGDPFVISCSNPLLSAEEIQAFCTAAGRPPGGQATLLIGRRIVEAGPRQNSLEHRDWRLVGGVRGQIGAWTYDVSVQNGEVAFAERLTNDISLSRFAQALDVVRAPSGALVCASQAQGCVPLDIFQVGGVTPGAVAFITTPASATGSTGETVVSGAMSGQLGAYGVRSPLAGDGVGVALGAEFRRESLAYRPDAEFASGDLADGPSSPPVAGGADVVEAYAEVRAPLIQGRGPWLEDLTLEAGYRFSSYSRAGDSSTYKIGLGWRVDPALRLTTSFNHAVRAPSVVELFTPQVLNIFGLSSDPCAGPAPLANDPLATVANCARTGVTAAQYGQIIPSGSTYNSLTGGNAKLTPEAADTVTAGVQVTPPFLPRLRLSFDWYRIAISGAITTIGADVIMQQCLGTGDRLYCGLIHRAPGTGSLWISPTGYVIDTNENTAALRAEGVDVAADWSGPLPRLGARSLGSVSVSLTGAWTRSFVLRSVPGGPEADCAGYYGQTCGSPQPRWRHVLRLGWTTPWNLEIDGAWRYIGATRLDLSSSQPALAGPFPAVDAGLGARSYFDLSLAWRVDPHVTVRVGAQNVLDTDPPLFAFLGALGNGNTFPSFYDALGRFLFVGVSARL